MPRKNIRERKDTKRIGLRKRACRFCVDKEMVIDYKMVRLLSEFITDRCKIVPRRTTGNCQFHQTRVVEAINRARHLALMPYTIVHAIRE